MTLLKEALALTVISVLITSCAAFITPAQTDTSTPAAPVVVGVTDAGTYSTTVNITIASFEANVIYVATIQGVIYTLASDYTTTGSDQLLVISASNSNNGNTAVTSLKFTLNP